MRILRFIGSGFRSFGAFIWKCVANKSFALLCVGALGLFLVQSISSYWAPVVSTIAVQGDVLVVTTGENQSYLYYFESVSASKKRLEVADKKGIVGDKKYVLSHKFASPDSLEKLVEGMKEDELYVGLNCTRYMNNVVITADSVLFNGYVQFVVEKNNKMIFCTIDPEYLVPIPG